MGRIKEKIEFEDKVFDIYNPEYSSDEEAYVSTCSLSGENGSRVVVKTSINKPSNLLQSVSAQSFKPKPKSKKAEFLQRTYSKTKIKKTHR
jgi:hypothetical protein